MTARPGPDKARHASAAAHYLARLATRWAAVTDPGAACQQARAAGLVVHRADPLNAETPLGMLPGGAVVPSDRFYVRNHFGIPALDVAGLAQALTEGRQAAALRGRAKIPDRRQLGPLAARAKRPPGSRAGDQCDEITAPHSMTSSARAMIPRAEVAIAGIALCCARTVHGHRIVATARWTIRSRRRI